MRNTVRWRWTRKALRAVASVEALLILTQAALAGQFLTGNTTARTLHRMLGTEAITWVAFIALVLALIAWRPGRHPAWPIFVTGFGFVAVILQLGYGFDGRLDLHIPLGLAIFGLYCAVALVLRPDLNNKAAGPYSMES